jgi:hypothetical protein
MGWGGIEWIDMGQDRYRWRALVNTIMNFRAPQNVKNFSSGETGSVSRRAQLRRVS